MLGESLDLWISKIRHLSELGEQQFYISKTRPIYVLCVWIGAHCLAKK
jgi:hypothetical protein